jgi:hypothetical protein
MSTRSYYEKSGLFLLPHNLLDEYLGKFSSMAKPLRLFDKTTWVSYSMSSRFGKAGEFPIPLSEISLHYKKQKFPLKDGFQAQREKGRTAALGGAYQPP